MSRGRLRRERRQARMGLQGLAAVGLAIGTATVLAAGPVSRLAGLPADPRGLWTLRLFGVRELVLGLGLGRAASANDPGRVRLMAELTVLAQAGDVLVTAAMLLAGSARRRAALAVLLGAPPTAAAALAIRAAYRGE